MSDLPYRLGLPAWAFPGWQDRYFPAEPSMLASYARVFNAVEGNTTFYRVPDERSVAAWREAVSGRSFEFCFKLPRTVTHRRRPDLDDLKAFLRAVEPLGEHLGPLLLQLPETVDAAALLDLEPVFRALPGGLRKVVEVRHPQFFEAPERLEPLLTELAAGRVVLDTRALYRGDVSHPEVRNAVHEKPDVPVLEKDYHGLSFTRLVLHPNGHNEPYLDEWARRVHARLAEGFAVTMMIHCPNNAHCPAFARQFHERLVSVAGSAAGTLADWPAPWQASLL